MTHMRYCVNANVKKSYTIKDFIDFMLYDSKYDNNIK